MISFSSSLKFIKKIGVRSFVWNGLRTAWTYFASILAFAISVAGLSDSKAWLHQMDKTTLFLWCLAALAVITVATFIWKWPKKLATKYTDRNGKTVIIECCDLLKQQGLKIIHTNSAFDTDMNVVFKESLHGQFLAYCHNQGIDVAKMVENSIKQKNLKEDENGCYPLGTILDFVPDADKLEAGNQLNDYRFVAFADYIDGQNLAVDPKKYRELLPEMWHNLSLSLHRRNEVNGRNVVNVAVMGNKFVCFPSDYTIEHKVDVILQEFFAASKKGNICDTLRICIHPMNADDFGFHYYNKIIQHIATRPAEIM